MQASGLPAAAVKMAIALDFFVFAYTVFKSTDAEAAQNGNPGLLKPKASVLFKETKR